MDRATCAYPSNRSIEAAHNVGNLVMFIDDDIRESALALARIEAYLVDTLGLLERQGMAGDDVRALASDDRVLDHVDMLGETLENLRRRMARLAASLRE
ncbi:MAG: hypothetical protein V3V08_13425 [Nannocystaceae bacterium]